MPFPNMLFPESDPFLDSATYALFNSLCILTLPAEIAELEEQVALHLAQIEAHHRHNEFLDVDLAGRLTAELLHLLERYSDYGAEQQQLITGAVRYFVHTNDVESDMHSILGMDDDVRVLNHVLTQIGHPQRRIDP